MASGYGYTAAGVVHIHVVVLPSLLLGTLILCVFYCNKKLRDPLSTLIIWITITCMTAPSTYGLLLDLSVITDMPLIGKCGTITSNLFWVFHLLFQVWLLLTTALIAIVQYILVKWGRRAPISSARVVIIIVIIYISSSLVALGSLRNPIFNSSFKVRGSVCCFVYSQTGKILSRIFGTFLGIGIFLPSIVTVVIFSLLSYRKVKLETLTLNNYGMIRSVVLISILMIAATIIFRLPQIAVYYYQDPGEYQDGRFLSWISGFSVELNFPCFQLLILTCHKVIKETLVDGIKHFWYFTVRKPTRVVPMLY